jgi:hypothetical protein
MKFLICVLPLFIGLLFCSKENNTNPDALTPEELLIKDNEISGWQRTGELWTGSSSTDLYEKINGGAEIYINRGFMEAAMQIYQGQVLGNTASVTLYIFDQGKTANAKSVFDELALGMSSPVDWTPGAGQEAKIERFSLSQGIIYYKSKYFISLSIDTGLDEGLDVLKTFAYNVDSKI